MKLWVCIIHTNPLYCIQGRYWHTFLQCQIAQLKSRNRQKGGQFFYQMSDFCENCNPYFSKSYTPPPLVNVWLIHDFQRHETEIVYMFKDSYWFELWGFIVCSNKQFEWAWSFKHVSLPLKRDTCSSQADGTHKVTRKVNIYCCLRNKKPKYLKADQNMQNFVLIKNCLEVGLQKILCHFSFTDNLLNDAWNTTFQKCG